MAGKKKKEETTEETTEEKQIATGVDSSDSTGGEMKIHPTKELLIAALSNWRLTKMNGLTYIINRCFAHHRLGEAYEMKRIFVKLESLSVDHEKMLQEMEAFSSDCLSELDEYLSSK